MTNGQAPFFQMRSVKTVKWDTLEVEDLLFTEEFFPTLDHLQFDFTKLRITSLFVSQWAKDYGIITSTRNLEVMVFQNDEGMMHRTTWAHFMPFLNANAKTLRELRFVNCILLTRSSFDEFVGFIRSCTNLHTLSFRNCALNEGNLVSLAHIVHTTATTPSQPPPLMRLIIEQNEIPLTNRGGTSTRSDMTRLENYMDGFIAMTEALSLKYPRLRVIRMPFATRSLQGYTDDLRRAQHISFLRKESLDQMVASRTAYAAQEQIPGKKTYPIMYRFDSFYTPADIEAGKIIEYKKRVVENRAHTLYALVELLGPNVKGFATPLLNPV